MWQIVKSIPAPILLALALAPCGGRSGELYEPCSARRLPGSVGRASERRLLGHGDDLGVGANFPDSPLARSGELDAVGSGVRYAARVVVGQLLGARDLQRRHALPRLLHGAQERRPPLRRGRDGSQGNRALHRSRSAGVPGCGVNRRFADQGRERAPLSCLEGGRQQPQAADADLGAAPVGQRHRARGRTARTAAQPRRLGGTPHRRPVPAEARWLVLHVLFRRRVLR